MGSIFLIRERRQRARYGSVMVGTRLLRLALALLLNERAIEKKNSRVLVWHRHAVEVACAHLRFESAHALPPASSWHERRAGGPSNKRPNQWTPWCTQEREVP